MNAGAEGRHESESAPGTVARACRRTHSHHNTWHQAAPPNTCWSSPSQGPLSPAPGGMWARLSGW
eukprot:scaffold211376_cov33-Tisochrysis_lutea.AAC.2